MMEKKRFAEAARILVAFGGSALIIDEAIGQDELVMVNELVHLFIEMMDVAREAHIAPLASRVILIHVPPEHVGILIR